MVFKNDIFKNWSWQIKIFFYLLEILSLFALQIRIKLRIAVFKIIILKTGDFTLLRKVCFANIGKTLDC